MSSSYSRRRSALIGILGIAVACATPVAQAAQGDPAAKFPERPMRLIVPFAPGGQPDIFSRLVGQKTGEALGQPMIVDNRAGAGGMIGAQTVAGATPDGYTLLGISSSHTILPSARRLPYDVRRDFAGISMIYSAAYLLIVPPSLGVATTQELIALARSKPGQLNFGSAGAGSGTYFPGEMFRHAAGIELTHVPYKGGSLAVTDLIAGRIQLMFASVSSVLPYVKAGKLRALAVSTASRSAFVPDVPAVAEAGLKGFHWASWGGLFAPSGTPRPIIDKLNRAVTATLRLPEVEKNMRALGADPAPTTPAELDRFVAQDLATVEKVAKLAGLKPE